MLKLLIRSIENDDGMAWTGKLEMRRRKFLILSALNSLSFFGTFGILGSTSGIKGLSYSTGLEVMQAKISSLFSDIGSAQSVGQRFIELYPDQANFALLLEGVGLRERAPTDFTTNDIDRLIREDFSSGHTVLIDGWVLAKTESNLCAILALS